MVPAASSAMSVALLSAIFWSAPATAAVSCDPFELSFATTPAPPQSAAQWRFVANELSDIPPGEFELALVGDSLAQLWPNGAFAPLRIANLGVGGDSTQHVLWRMNAPELTAIQPEKVLLVIGTNNLGTGSQPCAIVAGIKKIAETIKSIWPEAQTTALEIPPRGADFTFNNDWRLQTNEGIRLIPNLRTINVDSVVTCGWQAPCKNYTNDNLHFTRAGYEIITGILKAALYPN